MMVNKQQPKSHDLGPPKADFSAPPPYECSNTTMTSMPPPPSSVQHGRACLGLHEIQLQHHQLQLQLQHSASELHQDMPLRHGHGKLPTYEEVQMAESLNGGELPPAAYVSMHGIQPHAMSPLPPPPPPPPPNPLLANIHDHHVNLGGSRGAQSQVTFVAIDTSDGEQLTNATGDNSLLGTDTMFVTAFMVAFLFNWIGFLMLTCFCPTIAGRYGALSGFGLSLAKWTLIVKQSTDLASHENSWLWWLIMAFGFLICARALIQYVSIKRTWRLLSASAQERLLFFY